MCAFDERTLRISRNDDHEMLAARCIWHHLHCGNPRSVRAGPPCHMMSDFFTCSLQCVHSRAQLLRPCNSLHCMHLGFHDFMQLACRNMQKQSTVTVSTTWTWFNLVAVASRDSTHGAAWNAAALAWPKTCPLSRRKCASEVGQMQNLNSLPIWNPWISIV